MQGNPRVSTLLQALAGAEVMVLFAMGLGLLATPTALAEIWPWRLTPFNAAFLGAVYAASIGSAALVVLIGRWSPARVVLPMILIFSAVVLVVSLLHLGSFDMTSPATGLWLLLYLLIPFAAAYPLWRYRGTPPAGGSAGTLGPIAWAWIPFGLYGLALLLAPAASVSFWPWPIDEFHGRMYSVAFLTPAVGLFVLSRSAAWAEVLAVALALIAGGVLSLLALVIADIRAPRVDWSAAGTWAWIGICVATALVGFVLLRALSRFERPPGAFTEAALVVPPPVLALVFGLAFVAAGVGGFIPFFTPSDGMEHDLLVTFGHGRLVGLYPVNAVHSLFHLGIGLLGLWAFFRPEWSLAYVRGFAIVLAALTFMGLLPGFDTLFGLAPLHGHDVWLHGVEALLAGYVGFFMPRAAPPVLATV